MGTVPVKHQKTQDGDKPQLKKRIATSEPPPAAKDTMAVDQEKMAKGIDRQLRKSAMKPKPPPGARERMLVDQAKISKGIWRQLKKSAQKPRSALEARELIAVFEEELTDRELRELAVKPKPPPSASEMMAADEDRTKEAIGWQLKQSEAERARLAAAQDPRKTVEMAADELSQSLGTGSETDQQGARHRLTGEGSRMSAAEIGSASSKQTARSGNRAEGSVPAAAEPRVEPVEAGEMITFTAVQLDAVNLEDALKKLSK